MRNLKDTHAHVMGTLVNQKHTLYKQFLEQVSSGVE